MDQLNWMLKSSSPSRSIFLQLQKTKALRSHPLTRLCSSHFKKESKNYHHHHLSLSPKVQRYQRVSIEDGRNGAFVIGSDRFPASLLDLPCVVESYKTYDDNVLIKTTDIGQMIMVREESDPVPEGPEHRHGLTPPMRDVRRRRFRREPDLNPELVQRVEKDLLTARAPTDNASVEGESQRGKTTPKPAKKLNAVPEEKQLNGDEPERTDSDDSDDSLDPEG